MNQHCRLPHGLFICASACRTTKGDRKSAVTGDLVVRLGYSVFISTCVTQGGRAASDIHPLRSIVYVHTHESRQKHQNGITVITSSNCGTEEHDTTTTHRHTKIPITVYHQYIQLNVQFACILHE